jgi:hypothetical protein
MRSATARSSRSWLAVVWSRGRLERHLAPALHESRPHYATLVPVGRRARRFSARCGRDVCQPARSWHQLAHMLDGCRHDEDAMCAWRHRLCANRHRLVCQLAPFGTKVHKIVSATGNVALSRILQFQGGLKVLFAFYLLIGGELSLAANPFPLLDSPC